MSDFGLGVCTLTAKMGTHIVSGTSPHEEPWLNVRSVNSLKGTIIGRLVDGDEVNVLKSRNKWKKCIKTFN